MSSVPPEIQAMIWTIAESGDPVAVRQFEERYPEHRLELLKRINTVQKLKQAKGVSGAAMTFEIVQEAPKPALTSHPLFWLGLVGVSAIGFWGANRYFGSIEPTTASNQTRNQVIIQNDSRFSNRAEGPSAVKAKALEAPQTMPQGLPDHPNPVPTVKIPKPWERPISLHIERANLHLILQGLAETSGYRITIAPGTPDPEVRVDYDKQSPQQILLDLGQRFGFSVFEQGPGELLVIPAVDGKGPTNMKDSSPDQVPQPTE